MISPLSKYFDWWAVQFVTAMLPPANATDLRLEETVRFLSGPDFIPTGSEPAQVQFNSLLHFQFPTPRPGEFAENNVAHGRLYRCGDRWQEKPVIVLLHGASDFPNHRFRFPAIARRCNRAGFNAATLVAPYHFQRQPRPHGANGREKLRAAEQPVFPFPASHAATNRNYLRMAEAMAQGVAEIRALTGWLLQQGCPHVALWGISMGGWFSGLAACRDPRFAALVLNAPAVLYDFPFGELTLWRSIREGWQRQRDSIAPLNSTPLNLTTTQSLVPKENILMIEGIDDLLVRKETVERLWQSWEQPEIWRLQHGHLGTCCGGVPGLAKRVINWLSPRL